MTIYTQNNQKETSIGTDHWSTTVYYFSQLNNLLMLL